MLSSHIKFSLHLHSYLTRCLASLLGPWDLGVVRHLQIASVFLLALLHLVLVLGWVVLLVVPLVPGVQPIRCWHPRDIFPLSSLGHFLFWQPAAWADGLWLLLHFHVLPSSLGLGVLLSFFSQASFVSFCGSLEARVCTHTLAHLLSRTLSLLPAGTHGPACPCGFSCGLFLLEFVPLFLCPSLSLLARLCPSLGLLLAFGGGWGSTPSGGCGCAAPGAFVFVCVVRFG